MRNRRIAAIVLAVAVAGLTIAATSASARPQHAANATAKNSTNRVKAGGVFRVEWESSFDFTGGFDPTGEYLGEAFGIYSNLLVRTLVGYNHVAGAAGNVIVPDLATNLGTLSKDGLTYTFHLKDGIKFGPPLNREITSKDVAYAFQRIGTKSLGAQYGFYYDVIKGMTAFSAGKAKTISGIKTPDDKTIIFHLTQPTGDFLYRLAMPAAAPIPPEVGKCFTKAGDYGRDVISSGPYMIQGADQVNASNAPRSADRRPMSGFDRRSSRPSCATPTITPPPTAPRRGRTSRTGWTSRSTRTPTTSSTRSSRGDIEKEVAGQTRRRYSSQFHKVAAAARGLGRPHLVHHDEPDAPPFDDIHVRKAVNYIIDKAALQKAWGGPIHGAIATHIMPPTVLPGFPTDYNPYPSAGNHGDVAKAKAEMQQSKYDTNHDGLCDADAWRHPFGEPEHHSVHQHDPDHPGLTPRSGSDRDQDSRAARTPYTTIRRRSPEHPAGGERRMG